VQLPDFEDGPAGNVHLATQSFLGEALRMAHLQVTRVEAVVLVAEATAREIAWTGYFVDWLDLAVFVTNSVQMAMPC
jgi:hypothetical protein